MFIGQLFDEKLVNDAISKMGINANCHDVDVYMFPQVWGSTALGFGGIGCQALTKAYTVVVHDTMYTGKAVVYFAGRLAYIINKPNSKFHKCLYSFKMLPVREKSTIDDEK